MADTEIIFDRKAAEAELHKYMDQYHREHSIADLAPTHIRKSAEYVGALVYRFNSAENLVNALFDIGWLTSVNSDDKPTLCVVKN